VSRYRKPARTVAYWYDDDSPLCPDISVDEHVAIDTGLVWETGEPIMREPNPVGFGRDGEW
jgi:hypothetical protein